MSIEMKYKTLLFSQFLDNFQRKLIYYYYILIIIALSREVLSEINTEWNDNDILPANYSSDTAPVLEGKAVEVFIAVNVLSLIPDSNADMVCK